MRQAGTGRMASVWPALCAATQPNSLCLDFCRHKDLAGQITPTRPPLGAASPGLPARPLASFHAAPPSRQGCQDQRCGSAVSASWINARTFARTAGDSPGHACTTAARSGSSATESAPTAPPSAPPAKAFRAPTAPDSAPLFPATPVFSEEYAGSSIPRGGNAQPCMVVQGSELIGKGRVLAISPPLPCRSFPTSSEGCCPGLCPASFKVGFRDLQVVLLGDGFRVADPFADHVHRKLLAQLRLGRAAHVLERLAPRFQAGAADDPLNLRPQIGVTVAVAGDIDPFMADESTMRSASHYACVGSP